MHQPHGWSPSPRGQEKGQKRSRLEVEPRPRQPGGARRAQQRGAGVSEGRGRGGRWTAPPRPPSTRRPCRQQKAVCTIAAHEGTLAAIAFNSSGSRLASASEKVSAAHSRVLGSPPLPGVRRAPGAKELLGGTVAPALATHFRGRPSAPASAASSIVSADPGPLRVGREQLCPEPRGLTKNQRARPHRQIRVLGSHSRRIEQPAPWA